MNRDPNRLGRLFVLAFTAALAASCMKPARAQSVISGPFYSGSTESRYYLIGPGTYTQLRAKAVAMGGDLVSIDNAGENSFVASRFLSISKPYIGLNDAAVEGTLVWTNGSTSTFSKWAVGEPNNSASADFVRMISTSGEWDIVTASTGNEAVVEIPANTPIRVPSELPTIDQAVNAFGAVIAPSILVGPGTFDVSSSKTLSSVLLKGAGMGQTIVRTPTSGRAFVMLSSTVLSDMTIVNRSTSASVLVEDGLSRIRRVEFTSQTGSTSGKLIELGVSTNQPVSIESCVFRSSDVAISPNVNPLFVSNTIFRDLGAITDSLSSGGSVTFSNCVFTRNGPAALFGTVVDHTVSNSIFLSNTGSIPFGTKTDFCVLAASRNGVGNIIADPMFVNAAANDFRLQPGSPAIDAGYVARYISAMPEELADFAGNPRVTDDPLTVNALDTLSPIDLGAFEYQPPSCKADFNGDGFVDDSDFVDFAKAYELFICP